MAVDWTTQRYDPVAGVAERTVRARRKRLRIWIALGLVLTLLIGTWAAGIVTSTTTTGEVTASAPVTVSPGGNPVSRYDNALVSAGALAIGFSGTWGVISANSPIFFVNMRDAKYGTGTYYVAVMVINTVSGWERLQIEFHAFQLASGVTSCAGLNFAAAPVSSGILYVETEDAKVNLGNIQGGNAYCIGVRMPADGKARDPASTFIRRPTSDTVPIMPVLAATIGQVTTAP